MAADFVDILIAVLVIMALLIIGVVFYKKWNDDESKEDAIPDTQVYSPQELRDLREAEAQKINEKYKNAIDAAIKIQFSKITKIYDTKISDVDNYIKLKISTWIRTKEINNPDIQGEILALLNKYCDKPIIRGEKFVDDTILENFYIDYFNDFIKNDDIINRILFYLCDYMRSNPKAGQDMKELFQLLAIDINSISSGINRYYVELRDIIVKNIPIYENIEGIKESLLNSINELITKNKYPPDPNEFDIIYISSAYQTNIPIYEITPIVAQLLNEAISKKPVTAPATAPVTAPANKHRVNKKTWGKLIKAWEKYTPKDKSNIDGTITKFLGSLNSYKDADKGAFGEYLKGQTNNPRIWN
jgi:hypothetical protein